MAGITPACAGKTCPIKQMLLPGWDHPRVCGKDTWFNFEKVEDMGSPPRVRERHHRPFYALAIKRITPACAGKTYTLARSSHTSRDHPRVCGKDQWWCS